MKEFHINELRGRYHQKNFSQPSPQGTVYPWGLNISCVGHTQVIRGSYQVGIKIQTAYLYIHNIIDNVNIGLNIYRW